MREIFARMAELEREGRRFAVATVVRTTGSTPQVVGAKLFVETDTKGGGTLGDNALDARARAAAIETLRQGTARSIVLDTETELLVEPVMSRPRLVITGGGHVGLAIAKLGVQLDYDVTVIDDRPEFANRERFPGVSEVVNMDMVKAIQTKPIRWNTFVIVATRGHKLDSHCLRAAGQNHARNVGLPGRKRKTILIAQMLRGEGIP